MRFINDCRIGRVAGSNHMFLSQVEGDLLEGASMRLSSVLERASNKEKHENGKYELMLGYTLTGEQLWLSDLSTTNIKLSKGSIHEAYAAFGDTGNGGFHHPTSP